MGYVTAPEIVVYTGVDAASLDLQTEEEVAAQLEKWADQATEMVERHTNVTWAEGEVPLGVANAVLRIVGNMVAQAKLRRQTSILSLDEYSQRLVPDTVFTRSIKDDLEPYIRSLPKGGAPTFLSGNVSIQGSSGEPKAELIELSTEAVNYYHPLTSQMRSDLPDVWKVPND